jgi:hypothetical protein
LTTSFGRDARRLAAGLALALLAWFGGMAALVFFIEPPALIAFGPRAQLAAAIVEADASVLAMGQGFVTARADAPGLARRLYAGGAWFVWPALAPSCRRAT